MDTETYKVAKEILDKFGDKPQPTLQEVRTSPAALNRSQPPGSELRQRHVEPRPGLPPRSNPPPPQPPATPMNSVNPMKPPQQQMLSAQRLVFSYCYHLIYGSCHIMTDFRPVAMNYGHAPLRPLPRPILPRERGILDRMMDFFVGDGPHQRYALICRQCGGHNGMALQEEFEYVSYNCCYCYQFNPPRKTRPMGPRLPVPPPPPPPLPTLQSPKAEGEKKGEPVSNTMAQAIKRRASECESESDDSTSEGDAETPSGENDSSESEEVSEKMEVDVQEEDAMKNDDTGNETSSLR